MSRLTVDLTDHQHQTLKALAALQDKTISTATDQPPLPIIPRTSPFIR